MRRAQGMLVLLATLLIVELGFRAWFLVEEWRPGAPMVIYAIGGSTTVGEPFPVSFPHLACEMLGSEGCPAGTQIVNLAERGASIRPQQIALTSRLRHRDRSIRAAVLIYSGHNERLQPEITPPSATERVERWLLANSEVFRVLLPAFDRRFQRDPKDDLMDYEHFLRLAVDEALAADATPFLSTVVGNVAGIDPYPPRAALNEAARLAISEALDLVDGRRYAEARRAFTRITAEFPEVAAWASWYAGRCARALGDADEARRRMIASWDSARGLGFGIASTLQNDRVRQLAAETGAPLVDTERAFSALTPDGLPPESLFVDGHHPSLEGYRLIARGFAQALRAHFAISTPLRELPPGALERRLSRPWARDGLIDAHLSRVFWLVSVSQGHPAPRLREALARANLQTARTHDPDDLRTRVLAEVLPYLFSPRFLQGPLHAAWLTTDNPLLGTPCDFAEAADRVLAPLVEVGYPDPARRRWMAEAARWRESCAAEWSPAALWFLSVLARRTSP